MAYKCGFLDNDIYSAQDVNDIFARITSGGVVFTDTGYTFGDLNSAQSSVVSSGVTKDANSCKVVKSGSTYKISKGACFMNDGSTIIFDEDGQEIKITSGIVNYVYLARNLAGNTIDIVVSSKAGDEDSIPLAEISQSGEITDRRKYAKAKVDLATSAEARNFTTIYQQCATGTSETIISDLGDGAFSYLIVWSGSVSAGNTYQNREACGKNLIPLVEGTEIMVPLGRSSADETEQLYIKKVGQTIHSYIRRATAGAKYTLNMGVI